MTGFIIAAIIVGVILLYLELMSLIPWWIVLFVVIWFVIQSDIRAGKSDKDGKSDEDDDDDDDD